MEETMRLGSAVLPSIVLVGKIGARGHHKGIARASLEHFAEQTLVVAFGVIARRVDVDDPFVERRAHEIDGVGRPHAHDGEPQPRSSQRSADDLAGFSRLLLR